MESVWDYPRPPRGAHAAARGVVELDGEVRGDTRRRLPPCDGEWAPGSVRGPLLF